MVGLAMSSSAPTSIARNERSTPPSSPTAQTSKMRDGADALAAIETGEITVAVRSAVFDGIQVEAGEVIGLLNDVLTAHGHDALTVAMELLRQMQADDREIITVYYGQPVNETEAAGLQAVIQESYPDQAVELINGGQPHYHYILSVE